MTELRRFKSHIGGRNADVTIHPDRIEWSLTGLTGRRKGSEMVPMKAISSVTTKRDGIAYTAVQVIASGNTVDFRLGHGEAKKVKELLTSLVLGNHPSQQAAPSPAAPPTFQPPAAPPPPVDVIGQLTQLGALRDSGVLTDDEFAAQKAAILGTPAARRGSAKRRRPPSEPPPPSYEHLPPPPSAAP